MAAMAHCAVGVRAQCGYAPHKRMTLVRVVLASLAAVARSKPPSVEESQQQMYAAAFVAINAKHPATIREFARVVGVPPSDCSLGPADTLAWDALCLCTWRFLTKDGPKEITAGALYEDERVAQPGTVDVIEPGARDGGVLPMKPDDAEAAFRSGRYSVVASGGRARIQGSDGTIGTVEASELQAALVGGGHLVSARSFVGATLDNKYAKWPVQQRIDACTSSAGRVLGASVGETDILF